MTLLVVPAQGRVKEYKGSGVIASGAKQSSPLRGSWIASPSARNDAWVFKAARVWHHRDWRQ
jgi:hypothetical protein